MKPELPKYHDDEVDRFHPIFEYCAEAAINSMGMAYELSVEHHRTFSGITVDYSIENKSNNKIVLLVEIKRTISAVESTRYRHQALSYRKEADHLCQTKYYILTNLEQIDLFRYDPLRPRVSSQLIKGSPYISGSLKDEQSDIFLLKLTENIKSILTIALNDSGQYDENLDVLHGYLSTRINNQQNWHKFLMPFSYEYIRGSAINHLNLHKQIQNNRWKAADSYMNQPKRLSDKGTLIDFELVFKDPITDPNDTDAFNNLLLNIAFSNGKNRGKAEDVSEIIYDVLSLKRIPGIVETDEELAKLLALTAKDCLNRDLTSKEFLVDPAAGSGRLLTSAVTSCFTETSANNIWANEVESLFMEALSLRIGLCFANTISLNNTPKITLSDISDLTKDNFEKVKVILLNPPYISGVYSTKQRKKISKAIHAITSGSSYTNNGQIGLEGPFLELVHTLAHEDTVIAAIMPFSLLTRKSKEIITFRKYLIEKFGLTHIVTYPRAGLFDNVIKRTCIFVAKKGYSQEEIKWLEIHVPLERINLTELSTSLKSKSNSRTFSISEHLKQELILQIEEGWINDTRKEAASWFDKNFGLMCSPLTMFEGQIKRGTSGNTGSSDLSAISLNTKSDYIQLIPVERRLSAINNSDSMDKILQNDNAPCISPLIFDDESVDNHAGFISELINSYLNNKKEKSFTGKQKKAELSFNKVFDSLKKDINLFPPNSILLPRAIRIFGHIGLCLSEYNVSTNFIVLSYLKRSHAIAIASWLFSVFGQIQMEFLANDQEGVRKLEKNEIIKIKVPTLILDLDDSICSSLEQGFAKSNPINFKNIEPREIDSLWAKLISNSPDKILSEAYSLISDIVDERAP